MKKRIIITLSRYLFNFVRKHTETLFSSMTTCFLVHDGVRRCSKNGRCTGGERLKLWWELLLIKEMIEVVAVNHFDFIVSQKYPLVESSRPVH